MIQLLHPPYALFADDMTGANDTGVQFARAQCRVRTVFSGWNIRSLTGVDLVVVDTDSRNLEAAKAATIVRACVEQLLAHGIRPLYKKIDSTLRGPIGAELEAIQWAADFRQAIVCPAYPSTGRTVEDGTLLVYGQPVSETPIGRELISPVRESHIPTLIGGQCSLPTYHMPLQIVDQGEKAIAAVLADGDESQAVDLDLRRDRSPPLGEPGTGFGRSKRRCAGRGSSRTGGAICAPGCAPAETANAGRRTLCLRFQPPGDAGAGSNAARCRHWASHRIQANDRRADRLGDVGSTDRAGYHSVIACRLTSGSGHACPTCCGPCSARGCAPAGDAGDLPVGGDAGCRCRGDRRGHRTRLAGTVAGYWDRSAG